ncbi:MAG: carboxypeptidase-like regulatory domain-containing protein [Flavitalea sp.]
MLKSFLIAVVGAQTVLSGASALFNHETCMLTLQVSKPAVSIKGTVFTSANAPVGEAHIFVVRGEEEALSDSRGAFAFSSWQKFPLTLNIDHPDYKAVKVKVENAEQAILVKLEKK